MSLPASQRRALNQIEKTLTDDHPSLGPLFANFTWLAGHEAMPVTERVMAQPRRRPQPTWRAVATLIGLAVAIVALFTLTLTLPSPQACPGTVIAAAARLQSVPTGRQPACATQQNKPGKTSPAKQARARSTRAE